MLNSFFMVTGFLKPVLTGFYLLTSAIYFQKIKKFNVVLILCLGKISYDQNHLADFHSIVFPEQKYVLYTFLWALDF